MNVLFLSRWYPFPPDNGAKLRISNLLTQLSAAHDVDLLTFAEAGDRVDEASESALRAICRDVQVFPYRRFQPTSARSIAGLVSAQPRFLVDTHSEAFEAALDARLRQAPPDIVVASQLTMMAYGVRAARTSAVPVLFEELELALFRDAALNRASRLSALRHRLTWAKLGSYLRRSLPLFAACTVVSRPEREHLAEIVPRYRSVHVVPNAIDPGRYADAYGDPEPGSVIFAGALTYDANRIGADWFLRRVLPHLAEQVPDLRFRITGNSDGVDLSTLPLGPGCELTGYVPDVRPVIARSVVSVVPLLTGGGTRLKILESMALGTPVVATAKGAEGLDVRHGENILIADDPIDFVRWVEALLRDGRLRARIADGGRTLVRSRYAWDVVGPDFRSIVEGAARHRGGAAAGLVS